MAIKMYITQNASQIMLKIVFPVKMDYVLQQAVVAAQMAIWVESEIQYNSGDNCQMRWPLQCRVGVVDSICCPITLIMLLVNWHQITFYYAHTHRRYIYMYIFMYTHIKIADLPRFSKWNNDGFLGIIDWSHRTHVVIICWRGPYLLWWLCCRRRNMAKPVVEISDFAFLVFLNLFNSFFGMILICFGGSAAVIAIRQNQF